MARLACAISQNPCDGVLVESCEKGSNLAEMAEGWLQAEGVRRLPGAEFAANQSKAAESRLQRKHLTGADDRQYSRGRRARPAE